MDSGRQVSVMARGCCIFESGCLTNLNFKGITTVLSNSEVPLHDAFLKVKNIHHLVFIIMFFPGKFYVQNVFITYIFNDLQTKVRNANDLFL